MPRNITLDHVNITKFELEVLPNDPSKFRVRVYYRVEGSSNEHIFTKSLTRYSANHPSSPKLPGGWESTFTSLLTSMTNAINSIESL